MAAWIFAAFVLLACVGVLVEAVSPTADLECWSVDGDIPKNAGYDSLYGCREVP